MAKKTTKNSAPKTKDKVIVALSVNGKTLTGSASTIAEAILAVPAFTPKTTANLTVTKGGKATKPMHLNIVKLKRLFYPGLTGKVQRTTLEKNLAFYAN